MRLSAPSFRAVLHTLCPLTSRFSLRDLLYLTKEPSNNFQCVSPPLVQNVYKSLFLGFLTTGGAVPYHRTLTQHTHTHNTFMNCTIIFPSGPTVDLPSSLSPLSVLGPSTSHHPISRTTAICSWTSLRLLLSRAVCLVFVYHYRIACHLNRGPLPAFFFLFIVHIYSSTWTYALFRGGAFMPSRLLPLPQYVEEQWGGEEARVLIPFLGPLTFLPHHFLFSAFLALRVQFSSISRMTFSLLYF